MKQENDSRLFSQMMIMKGIEDEYLQLCKSQKYISTEQVEILLGYIDTFLDEILTVIRDESDNENSE